MADLITLARAKQNIAAQPSFTSDEDSLLEALISAISAAAISYCRQPFVKTDFDELYDGTGRRIIRLNQYPVWQVDRVASTLAAVLKITNTSTATIRALAGVTKDGTSPQCRVRLRRLTSSWLENDFGGASNPTLGEVAIGINSHGNGWSATVTTGYSNWPTSELTLQPMRDAKNRVADINLHTEDLHDFEVDGPRGLLLMGATGPAGLFPEDSAFGTVWTLGINNYRVQYTACGEEESSSYAVPHEVQEAVAEWVAMLFHQSKRDPGLVQSSLLNVGTVITLVNRQGVPNHVRALLSPHRRHRFGTLN